MVICFPLNFIFSKFENSLFIVLVSLSLDSQGLLHIGNTFIESSYMGRTGFLVGRYILVDCFSTFCKSLITNHCVFVSGQFKFVSFK